MHNSGNTFQRLMVLAVVDCAFPYLDDIFVFSKCILAVPKIDLQNFLRWAKLPTWPTPSRM
jgi:hypothetical protein